MADTAARDHGMRVVLTGGPSPTERELGAAIEAGTTVARPLNLIGRLSLKGTLAVMARSTALISPDSGPAHMAAMVDLPVIGLYAVMNVHRTGPYKSIDYCVDAYPAAARRFLGKPPEELRWGQRVEDPGAMDCITPAMVEERLAAVMAARPADAG